MMKHRTPDQILDQIAQKQLNRDIDLSSNILKKVRKENQKMIKRRVVLGSVCTIAVIFVILFSIPGVASAMKRLMGYIPGAGLVENNPQLRILAQPSQLKQAGTTITVKQGVIDSKNTTLVYQVENIPASNSLADTICHQLPELRLPDGSSLQGRAETGDNWTSGYSRRIVFPALPYDTSSVNLVFTCLEQTPITSEMPKWEIPLEFVKAPADKKIYPLVDIPTPTAVPTSEATSALVQQETSQVPYSSDLQLVVKRYVQTDENLFLLGSLESQSGNLRIDAIDDTAFHLYDVTGKEIPTVFDPTMMTPEENNPDGTSLQWAYRTEGNYSPGPAKLVVDAAWVGINGNSGFTFDPGTNPQPNQVWILNQPFTVAGQTIVIESAQMSKTGDGLTFNISTSDQIAGVVLEDTEHAVIGGGGGPGSSSIVYRDGFPSGKINILLATVSLSVAGPWQTSVDLPASEKTNPQPEISGACLTESTWQAAIKEPLPLPGGLNGQLAIYSAPAPDYLYQVMTANLDGTNQRILARGDNISLSPDGRQAIFNGDTGLIKMDLTSLTSAPLLNSGRYDQGAMWSPDGTKIVFTRGPISGRPGAPGPHSLMLINSDGTGLQPLLENTDANIAQVWTPDGQNVIYTVKGPEGASVRSINISTRQTITLFQINYTNAGVSISPDGKQAAFETMLPGENYGVMVADLDGTNQKLIVDAAPMVVTGPQWSPNGKWIIVSVHDEKVSPDMPVLALVNVDTCQVIPLTNLKGYVSTWNK